MYWISKSIHLLNRLRRQLLIFLAVLGPGIITMVADNDAGGISTYAVTGSKYGFNLLWVFIILVPMAYYVQEMTVRLGAVTKRGHAEAIFDGFGPFWGWFSIFDLAIINWLTLVTEYIGMTAAMSIFGIPPWITFLGVTADPDGHRHVGQVLDLREDHAVLLRVQPRLHPGRPLGDEDARRAPAGATVLRGLLPSRTSRRASRRTCSSCIMANIGTTITPWQIFFQQSAVVDKGMDIQDIKFGKIDTFVGSLLTCIVAAFIIIATGAAFYYHDPPDRHRGRHADGRGPGAAPARRARASWPARLFAIGLFDAGFLGALCISLSTSWARGRGVRLGPLAEQERPGRALVLRRLPGHAADRRRGGA